MAQFSLSSMTSQSFVVTVTLPGNWQKRFEMALNKNTNATLELRNLRRLVFSQTKGLFP